MIEGTENACGTDDIDKLFIHFDISVVNGKAHGLSHPTGEIIFVNYTVHFFTSASEGFLLFYTEQADVSRGFLKFNLRKPPFRFMIFFTSLPIKGNGLFKE